MRTSFLALILFTTTTLFSQNIIWADANWENTTEILSEYKIEQGNNYWIIKPRGKGKIKIYRQTKVNNIVLKKFNGIITFYVLGNKPLYESNYKNGKIDGLKKTYYTTGELKEVGRYRNGIRQGVWKVFYKNGKIKNKGKYKKGKKAGVWKTFYKNFD